VVEGARLERVWAGNCPVSSNLTLSAIFAPQKWLANFYSLELELISERIF